MNEGKSQQELGPNLNQPPQAEAKPAPETVSKEVLTDQNNTPVKETAGRFKELYEKKYPGKKIQIELSDPRVLASWEITGRIASELHDTVVRLLNPEWINRAKTLFERVGLNIDKFTSDQLTLLKQKNPQMYEELRSGLIKINQDPQFINQLSRPGINTKVNK